MEECNNDTTFKKENYIINISLKKNYISLIITESQKKEEYIRIISSEYFANKNSFFSYFTIIGIKDFLINIIKDSSNYNIIKENKNIKLILSLKKINESIEIIIPLSESQITVEDNINIIKNENLNLKEEINELKKRLKLVEDTLKNNNIEWRGFTNKIIKNKDEVKQLLNWINPNEKYRVNLLYDASIEENTNKDFHKYCDGKGAVLLLL